MHNRPHSEQTKLKLRGKFNVYYDWGDYCELFLTGSDGRVKGRTKISSIDLPTVKNYRWALGNHGYAKSTRLVNTLHKFIMGECAGKEIDHINRDKLDNRRENLRFVNRVINSLNKDNKSIYYNKTNEKWIAEVSHKYLGSFIKKEDAIKASEDYKLYLINLNK